MEAPCGNGYTSLTNRSVVKLGGRLAGLRHHELLEAAHIVADSDPEGEPVVSNGLALCKLHHAAFDANILGVHPDYRVEVRPRCARKKSMGRC